MKVEASDPELKANKCPQDAQTRQYARQRLENAIGGQARRKQIIREYFLRIQRTSKRHITRAILFANINQVMIEILEEREADICAKRFTNVCVILHRAKAATVADRSPTRSECEDKRPQKKSPSQIYGCKNE